MPTPNNAAAVPTLVRSNSTGTNCSITSSDYGFQDWRERGGGSGESVFHSSSSSNKRGGGSRGPNVQQQQPVRKQPKSVTFGENRISVFLRDPTTIAQASQQG